MADTTKDIWNDDDGEEALQKKSHRFRRFLIFFVVLVVVLAVVLLAAYRDGTGFDVLRRYFYVWGNQGGKRFRVPVRCVFQQPLRGAGGPAGGTVQYVFAGPLGGMAVRSGPPV